MKKSYHQPSILPISSTHHPNNTNTTFNPIHPSSSHSKSNSLHSRFQFINPTHPTTSSSSSSSSSPSPSTPYHPQSNPYFNLKSLLFSRSRITNLALILLTLTLFISLYFNLTHSTSIQSPIKSYTHFTEFKSIQNTLSEPRKTLNRLIIVPCHGIFKGTNPTSSTDWLLESYQSVQSIQTFIKHIQEAIKLNLIRTDSLLIYSGGQTKSNSNQTCHESDSYSKVAHLLNLYQLTFDRLSNDKNPSILQIKEKFDLNQFLKDRVTTEDFALDSWSNLLFSVARFKEFTGHYPHHITVIGHSFKSKRFQEIHREALRWPSDRFEYVAIPDEITDLEARYEGERRVIEEFDRDRYGCFGRLREKRIRRNPFRRFHSYLIGAWELMGLFEWCPTNGIDWYPHPLPWSTPTP